MRRVNKLLKLAPEFKNFQKIIFARKDENEESSNDKEDEQDSSPSMEIGFFTMFNV
jgi:hypothetical protein